ncbi:mediator of RNA polymerase II transcription subunit 14 [Tanacetum coccineum]
MASLRLFADSIFFIHEGLQQARAPIYDVSSAIEILLIGTYERFPKCTEDVGIQSTLTEINRRRKPVLMGSRSCWEEEKEKQGCPVDKLEKK